MSGSTAGCAMAGGAKKKRPVAAAKKVTDTAATKKKTDAKKPRAKKNANTAAKTAGGGFFFSDTPIGADSNTDKEVYKTTWKGNLAKRMGAAIKSKIVAPVATEAIDYVNKYHGPKLGLVASPGTITLGPAYVGAREAAKYMANNVHTPAANTGLQALARNLRYADKENRDRIAGLLKCVVNDACEAEYAGDPAVLKYNQYLNKKLDDDKEVDPKLKQDIEGFQREEGKLVIGKLGANKSKEDNWADIVNIVKAPYKGNVDEAGAINTWGDKQKSAYDGLRIPAIQGKIEALIPLLDERLKTDIGRELLSGFVKISESYKWLKDVYVDLRQLRKSSDLAEYQKTVLKRIKEVHKPSGAQRGISYMMNKLNKTFEVTKNIDNIIGMIDANANANAKFDSILAIYKDSDQNKFRGLVDSLAEQHKQNLEYARRLSRTHRRLNSTSDPPMAPRKTQPTSPVLLRTNTIDAIEFYVRDADKQYGIYIGRDLLTAIESLPTGYDNISGRTLEVFLKNLQDSRHEFDYTTVVERFMDYIKGLGMKPPQKKRQDIVDLLDATLTGPDDKQIKAAAIRIVMNVSESVVTQFLTDLKNSPDDGVFKKTVNDFNNLFKAIKIDGGAVAKGGRVKAKPKAAKPKAAKAKKAKKA